MHHEFQAARILLEKLGPGPSPESQRIARAEAHVRAWARTCGLIRSDAAQARFDKTAPGGLAALVYASAADPDRLEAAADWIGWLFLLDDQLDEGPTGRDPVLAADRLRPFAQLMPVVPASQEAGGQTADTPLLAALSDIWRRISPAMPAAWCQQFAGHFLDYLHGCEWEAANRALGRVPQHDEFIPMRRDAGAIWPSLDLLEFVAHAPIPDCLRHAGPLTSLRQACADVVCWTDDLLTISKERAHGDVHNLAIVLEHATGCDPRSAVEMVVRRIDERLADFRELEEQVQAMELDESARDAVRCHVTGLRHWMRGHLDWGLTTIRYGAVPAAAYLEELLG